MIDANTLVERLVAGEADVWPELVKALWEPCLAIVGRSRAMRSLGLGEDEVREVATRVLTRLARDDYRALRLYAPWQRANPDKLFEDWFKIVVANVVRDFAREQRGGHKDRAPGEPSPKRLLNQFAGSLPLDELGARPPMTDAQTAKQLLHFAERHLSEDQLYALERWLQGASYEDIGADRALAPADARKLVRAAVATLRRHFA